MLWCSCLLLLALSGVGTAQAPQPPGPVQVFSVDERSVSYSFTASLTTGATYRVTFTPQRDGIPVLGPLTVSPSYRTTSGLIPDVDYTLRVVAVRNGEESTPVSATFTTTPDVPTGPPLNLAVSARNTTSVTLTWSDPAPDKINDRDGITGFVLRRDGMQVATVTVQRYTFTGLNVSTRYNFEVLAINENGTAPDNHAARLTVTTASDIPSSPTLRVVLPRFSSNYLEWNDPKPFVGPITGFQIRYLIDGVARNIPELGGEVHKYFISGIKDSVGKTHNISLRAKTTAGYGDYSEPFLFTFQPIVVIDVTPVGCDTLQVDYTVKSLPGGDSNEASLQSLVVEYNPILSVGSSGRRNVPLNGNSTDGVLCLSGITPDTGYRVTYEVEVMTSSSNPPSDVPDPIRESTGDNCDLPEQCTEAVISIPGTTEHTASPTNKPEGSSSSAAVSVSAVLTIAISLLVALAAQANVFPLLA